LSNDNIYFNLASALTIKQHKSKQLSQMTLKVM